MELAQCEPPLRRNVLIDEQSLYEQAAGEVIERGNDLCEENPELDAWSVADGLLAGAIHFWLYSRQPCDNSDCEDCAPIGTALGRYSELKKLVEALATESEYYQVSTDRDVGHA